MSATGRRLSTRLVFTGIHRLTVTKLARTASRCQRAYILPLWFFFLSFFFFFIRRLISKVTERISTKRAHCYLKNLGRTPLGIYPNGLGTKSAFWDRLWTLTERISATEHDVNNRKETCQSTGSPLHAAKFVELWNGWERLASFCPPLHFRIGRHCHQQYNLVPAKGRWCFAAGKVTAGPAESNGSLPPGVWLIVTCGLTACTPWSALCLIVLDTC